VIRWLTIQSLGAVVSSATASLDPGGVSSRQIYRLQPRHWTPEGSPLDRYLLQPNHWTPKGLLSIDTDGNSTTGPQFQ